MKRFLLFSASVCAALTLATTSNVQAATTWDQVPTNEINIGNAKSIKAATDGKAIYIESVMRFWVPAEGYHLQIGKHNFDLTLTSSNLGSNNVSAKSYPNWPNTWPSTQLGNIGTAVVSTSQVDYVIEDKTNFVIPLANLGLSASDLTAGATVSNAAFSSQAYPIVNASGPSGETTDNSAATNAGASSSSESSQTSSQDNGSGSGATNGVLPGENSSSQSSSQESQTDTSNVSGRLGITIDGNVSDWDDIAKQTTPFYGRTDGDSESALVRDGSNVYFYLDLKSYNGAVEDMQGYGYDLNVSGVVYHLYFTDANNSNLGLGEKKALTLKITANNTEKTYTDLAYLTKVDKTYENSQGRKFSKGYYALECRVPFDRLPGASNESSQPISMSNSTLWTGGQKIVLAGGSTAPYVIAGIGAAIAVFAVIKFSGVGTKLRRFKLRGIK